MITVFALLFVSGLAIGSFLNVIACRYYPGETVLSRRSIGGRSRCPRCHENLRWFELIPIASFFLQRGKCGHCDKRISWQYPIVELLSGLIFVSVPYYLSFYSLIVRADILRQSVVGFYLENVIFILAFTTLLLIGVIDYRYRVIPNGLNLFLGMLGVALIFTTLKFDTFYGVHSGVGIYSPIFGWANNIFLNRIAGILAGALIIGLPVFISGGKVMGLGDFKLALVLGLLFGWPNIVFIFFSAFVIGSLVGAFLIIKGRKKFRSAMPFAPFISFSAIIIFLWGEFLLGAYFRLFGI